MKLGLYLGAITAANMLCWFLFQGYVFASGVGPASDAFFASLALPQLIALIANSSLMHVLVPFFASEAPPVIQKNAYSLIYLLTGVLAATAALLYWSASWWVPLVVIGFSDEAKLLTVVLSRIQLIGMIFAGLGSVLLSACHAQHQFVRAESAPLIATAIAFAALLIVFPRYGVLGAAWLTTARALLMVLLLLPALGLPVRADMAAVGRVWIKLKVLLLSASYYKSDQVFDRFLSSMAAAGSLSVFYFAQQIYMAANAVIGKAIAAPIVPRLAGLAKTGDWHAFHALYRKRLLLISLLALGCWLVLLVAGGPLLQLLGQVKNIAPSQLAQMHGLLVILGGIMIGGLAGLILVETCFAMGNARTPALVLAVAFTLGLLAKAGGFMTFGMSGLAAGTSLYFLAYPAVLYFLLERDLTRLRALRENGAV